MSTIFSSRLKAARKMAGLSMQDLADKLGITKQAVGKYEQGLMQPTSTVLIKLAEVLQVKVDYFFRSQGVEFQGIEFRKRSKLSMKGQEAVLERAKDFLERYLELEDLMNIESSFKNPLDTLPIQTVEDAENAADLLRKEWRLGIHPIANIIEILEEQGIKVIEIGSTGEFDGLFAWAGAVPLIVLNAAMNDTTRKRFTAIHELAHLLLKLPDSAEPKIKESLCNVFAGTFLLPKEVLIAELGAKRSKVLLRELITLKEYFGISIRAILMRTRMIGIISESYYQGLCIFLNKKWGGKEEPGQYMGKEESTRFRQLLYRAVAEEIISIGKAASLGNITVAEFEKNMEQAG